MRLRTVVPALAALVLAGCIGIRKPPAPQQDVTVTFLDVGQADAALIRTPKDETILIDTGRNANTARRLREKRVRRIDLLILSHPHEDHIGGLSAVAKTFPIRETWYSGLDYKPRTLGRLEKMVRLTPVSAGSQKQFAKLLLTVLHPDATPVRPRSKDDWVNNNSLVIKAVYGTSEFLFPGDCELECWDELFKNHRRELRANVLKAAHHGSNNGTNSGVLINVRPQTFVISVGDNNEYHHPNPLVLALAGKLGAQILRTDRQGEIRCIGTACAPVSGQ